MPHTCVEEQLSTPSPTPPTPPPPPTPHFDSREQDFFAQLELDFDLEAYDPNPRQPLDARLDEHTLQREEPSANSATSRGVYLLLGARGSRQPGNEGVVPSPLDEWHGTPSILPTW